MHFMPEPENSKRNEGILCSPFFSPCTRIIPVFGIFQNCICLEVYYLGFEMSFVSMLYWQEIVHTPNKPISEESSECKWIWDYQKQGSTHEVPCMKQSTYVCMFLCHWNYPSSPTPFLLLSVFSSTRLMHSQHLPKSSA